MTDVSRGTTRPTAGVSPAPIDHISRPAVPRHPGKGDIASVRVCPGFGPESSARHRHPRPAHGPRWHLRRAVHPPSPHLPRRHRNDHRRTSSPGRQNIRSKPVAGSLPGQSQQRNQAPGDSAPMSSDLEGRAASSKPPATFVVGQVAKAVEDWLVGLLARGGNRRRGLRRSRQACTWLCLLRWSWPSTRLNFEQNSNLSFVQSLDRTHQSSGRFPGTASSSPHPPGTVPRVWRRQRLPYQPATGHTGTPLGRPQGSPSRTFPTPRSCNRPGTGYTAPIGGRGAYDAPATTNARSGRRR